MRGCLCPRRQRDVLATHSRIDSVDDSYYLSPVYCLNLLTCLLSRKTNMASGAIHKASPARKRIFLLSRFVNRRDLIGLDSLKLDSVASAVFILKIQCLIFHLNDFHVDIKVLILWILRSFVEILRLCVASLRNKRLRSNLHGISKSLWLYVWIRKGWLKGLRNFLFSGLQ